MVRVRVRVRVSDIRVKIFKVRAKFRLRVLTAQQKDERWQDNGDKKRLVRYHERDRQRTTRHYLDSTLSFAILSDQTFHVLRVRHIMRMCIPINSDKLLSLLLSVPDSDSVLFNYLCSLANLFWILIVTLYPVCPPGLCNEPLTYRWYHMCTWPPEATVL